jgi:hypothetical protein
MERTYLADESLGSLFLTPVSNGQAIAQRGPVYSGVTEVSSRNILFRIGNETSLLDLQCCNLIIHISQDEGNSQEASEGDSSAQSQEMQEIRC